MDVVSGQVPLMFSSMGLAQQNVKSCKLRMVAVGGEKRSFANTDSSWTESTSSWTESMEQLLTVRAKWTLSRKS